MIVVPAHPNAIQISMMPTGCCKSEFDSTYPAQLTGIINQIEFQESIKNINQTISSSKAFIFFGIVFLLFILGGMALFIAGGITAANSRTFGFPVLVGIGFGVFFLGMIILMIGCCIIQTRQVVKMQNAIADESKKYSSRSPTPCSWRLNSTRFNTGGYRNRRTTIIYRITIEIGHSGTVASRYVPNQSTSFSPSKNNLPSAPSNDDRSATRFCSHCGMPRQNPTAQFCSSCGQPLNMF